MNYPCFVYDMAKGRTKFADNKPYLFDRGYSVTYITSDPDDAMIETIATYFPKCTFDRHYVSDNLHHYVFTIFY